MGYDRNPKRPTGGVKADGFNIIRDRIFVGDNILVDGCHFVDCEFVDCTLSFAGGAPFVVTSSISPGFTAEVQFIGAAANVLVALQAMYGLGMATYVDFVINRIKNPEGGTLQ